MSEQKHTPGTLSVHEAYVDSKPSLCTPEDGSRPFTYHSIDMACDGKIIGTLCMWDLGEDGGWPRVDNEEELQANVRRVMACWNACAGIPTDVLEQDLKPKLDVLREQRDELLAALEAYVAADRLEGLGPWPLHEQAKAAIAKVK